MSSAVALIEKKIQLTLKMRLQEELVSIIFDGSWF